MELPPPRYRVVERGRRLEVIDTWKGEAVSAQAPLPMAEGTAPRDLAAPPIRTSGSAPKANAGPDSGSFVTRPWYDSKAPRLIPLNERTRARIGNLRTGIAVATAVAVALFFLLWPFALIALFAVLASGQVRRGLRGVSTGWIDALDQAARDPSAG